MCGICGVYSYISGQPATMSLLHAMAGAMVHRGPDDEGYHADGPLGLGMRRLSIIDLAGGRQPIADETGTIFVVCNGEIYNAPALRRELEGRGHVFRTRTDVEAIVHLYQEAGERCVERLDGMFAFALWDARGRRLLLARDRTGKKPLFFARTPNGLTFASSLRSILRDPAVVRSVDLESVHHYLTWQYTPEPATMFAGIEKLPPAHRLVCEAGGQGGAGSGGRPDGRAGSVRIERYWDLAYTPKRTITEADAAVEVRAALKEATRVRLASDVPLGAFLSGGVDSTAVVELMTELGAGPVKTFSIGFEEAGFDELAFARVAARRYGTDHHEFTVRPDALAVLPEIVRHLEEPMADMSAVPTWYLSKLTRGEVTVALSGDGGDEAFAGYDRYRVFLAARRMGFLPAGLRRRAGRFAERLPESDRPGRLSRRIKRFAATLALPDDDRYAQWLRVFDEGRKSALYTDDMRERTAGLDSRDYLRRAFERAGDVEILDRLLYADTTTYLPGDLLVKADRMSMAHSLEVRSPFLDHHVLELAAALPASFKLRGRTSKWILKRAMRGLVPDEIIGRRKMGFGVPVARWFRGELKDLAFDTLLDGRARERGYFRPEAVAALLNEHLSGRYDHGHRIWALLVLELVASGICG